MVDIPVPAYHIAQDDTRVYTTSPYDDTVFAVDKRETTTVEVATHVPDPGEIVVDQTHVYWTSGWKDGVWTAPKPSLDRE